MVVMVADVVVFDRSLKHHENEKYSLMAGNVDDIPLDTEEGIVQCASKLEYCLFGVILNELSISAFSVDGRNHISR
jgi:hypothetical protein